ncbi:hypothetical protein BH09ACT11_BH09ACT11_04960 [soil metagenome]
MNVVTHDSAHAETVLRESSPLHPALHRAGLQRRIGLRGQICVGQ